MLSEVRDAVISDVRRRFGNSALGLVSFLQRNVPEASMLLAVMGFLDMKESC